MNRKIPYTAPLTSELDWKRQHVDGRVIGIDEAGRGCLAGPVVAGAVEWIGDVPLTGLRDSKKMSQVKRDKALEEIKTRARIGVGVISCGTIDEINILQATFQAMRAATEDLLGDDPIDVLGPSDMILVDGNQNPWQGMAHTFVVRTAIKGDDLHHSIAGASVVAKVSRDRYMMEASFKHPGYSFEKNKGYGTKEHVRAIGEIGYSPLHRRTFRIKALCSDRAPTKS